MFKYLLTILLVLSVTLATMAQGWVNPNYHPVRTYTRKDGTVVQGHMRTNPNSTNRDNYSTLGNTNPWTGEAGTVPPDNKPMPSYYSWPFTTPLSSNYSSTTGSTNENIILDYNWGTGANTTDNTFKPSSNTSTYTPPSSYSPSNRYVDLSAGKRTVRYKDGHEEFNVVPASSSNFNPKLTYYIYDPYQDEVIESIGGAGGKLLLDGTYRFYDNNNRLLLLDNYRKGLKHGVSILYDESGLEVFKKEYTSGIVTYHKSTEEDGTTYEVVGELDRAGTRMTLSRQGAVFKKIEFLGPKYFKSTEYGNNQNRTAEYTHQNGLLHGTVRFFEEDGKTLSEVKNYQHGQLDGQFIQYLEGKPIVSGSYKMRELHGRWTYHWKDSTNYYPVQWVTYQNGILHGPFQIIRNDTITVGAYQNNLLEGAFKAYRPWSLWLFGFPPESLRNEELIYTGQYINGQRTGHWKFYSLTKTLLEEGNYVNDEKHGEWRYYVETIFNEVTQTNLPCSGQLYLTENYLNGKMHGKYERKLYLHQKIIPCNLNIGTVHPEDTCYETVCMPIRELAYFKDDNLHGPYEIYDESGGLTAKGSYSKGQRSGPWIDVVPSEFNPDSLLRFECGYADGKLDGQYKKIDAKTNALLETGTYFDNKRVGTWKGYYPFGNKVNTITVYKQGYKESEKHLDYDGNNLFYATYNQGFMKTIDQFDSKKDRVNQRYVIQSFKDGQYTMDYFLLGDTSIQVTMIYSPGYLEPEDDPFMFVNTLRFLKSVNPTVIINEGPIIIKRKDGAVNVKGTYKANLKQGTWLFYYRDQNVLEEIQYEADEKTGEKFLEITTAKPFSGKLTKHVSPDGEYLVIQIKKGVRHGATTRYDANKKVIKKTEYKLGVKKEE